MSSVRPSALLKLSLLLDAAGSAALGALQLAAAPLLAAWLALPQALVFEVGLVMLPYALMLFVLQRRATLAVPLVRAVVVFNLLWAAGAAAVLALTTPSALGMAFIALHALWVLAFAVLQARGLAASVRQPAMPAPGRVVGADR